MKFLETRITQVAQQINTRAPNQFPSQPEQKGKEPNQVTAVIEMKGKDLADNSLHEVSSTKPIGNTSDIFCVESLELDLTMEIRNSLE